MARKKSASLKFGEAREELERILEEIEENEVDVDDLADRVKRAAELIRICREKLERTKIEVEKVVADLDSEEEEEEAGGEEDEEETPF
jgi:exodeoxyribonuclease VII small subunit